MFSTSTDHLSVMIWRLFVGCVVVLHCIVIVEIDKQQQQDKQQDSNVVRKKKKRSFDEAMSNNEELVNDAFKAQPHLLGQVQLAKRIALNFAGLRGPQNQLVVLSHRLSSQQQQQEKQQQQSLLQSSSQSSLSPQKNDLFIVARLVTGVPICLKQLKKALAGSWNDGMIMLESAHCPFLSNDLLKSLPASEEETIAQTFSQSYDAFYLVTTVTTPTTTSTTTTTTTTTTTQDL